MKLATYTQQPGERYQRSIDYSEALKAGDTITSVSASVDPAGPTLSGIDNTDDTVTWWVTGGTDGQTYKVTLVVTTTAGEIFEDEVTLKIKEV